MRAAISIIFHPCGVRNNSICVVVERNASARIAPFEAAKAPCISSLSN